MSVRPKIDDMIEATRLTRQGRLEDAMAVLREVLSSAAARSFQSDVEGDAAPCVIDMAQPPPGTGGFWTSFNPSEAPSTDRERMKLIGRFLNDRMKLGSAGNLNGLLRAKRVHTPPPLPDGAKFEQFSFANEAGERTYKLYVPSGYTGQALPLVVMLHGCTQSPDDFAAGTRMNDLAEEQTFLVAYPEQPQTANISRCWNWFRTADQQRESGEPSLIAGVTRQVMRDYAVEAGRVYIAGLSAGGAAAAIMGSTYPDLYAAIGVHSGLACGAASDLPSAFAAMRQGEAPSKQRVCLSQRAIPTIVFHGDRDATVNPANGDQVIAQSKAGANFRTTVSRGTTEGGMTYTRTIQTDENDIPTLEHWAVHGAGHAWFGGSASGPYTEPRGPNASREIMRFFMLHTKRK